MKKYFRYFWKCHFKTTIHSQNLKIYLYVFKYYFIIKKTKSAEHSAGQKTDKKLIFYLMC